MGKKISVVFAIFFWFCQYRAASNCKSYQSSRVKLPDVIKGFNEKVSLYYVGQKQAIKEARIEIEEKIYQLRNVNEMDQNKISNVFDSLFEPLVLHFVGPSGTGKSFLAELIASSIFKPEYCHPVDPTLSGLGLGSVSTAAIYSLNMLNPVTAIGAAGIAAAGAMFAANTNFLCYPLDDWRRACGIVHASFSEGSSESNLLLMENALKDLADTLRVEKYAVFVLDDFIFCTDSCTKPLEQLLKDKLLELPDGTGRLQANRVFILITSDLTNFGIDMHKGEGYLVLLGRVIDAVREYWKEEDTVIDNLARVIPFAPLTDGQIREVAEKMISKFELDLKSRIRHKMLEMSTSSEEYEWSGIFYCEHTTKLQIIDHLHRSIEIKNSRAIVEEFRHMLLRTLIQPARIEDRISSTDFKESRIRDESLFGIVKGFNPFLKKKNSIVKRHFSQDIVLKFVPGERNYVKLFLQ